MEFSLAPALEQTCIDRISEKFSMPRDRIHLSDTDMCGRKTVLSKTHYIQPSTPLAIKMMQGEVLAWFMQSAVQEVEKVVDGIICTVDEMGVEYKTTGMSANNIAEWMRYAIDGRQVSLEQLHAGLGPVHFIRRIMGYAHVWKRTDFNLVMLMLMGNYGSKQSEVIPPSRQPMMFAFNVKFTPEELATNWERVKERAQMIDSALKMGEVPPVTARMYDWECGLCPYLELYCREDLLKRGMFPKE